MARILVIDDEQSVLTVLDEMLKREGYDVTTTPDGNEAVKLMGSHHFDVVITDLKMEPINGLEILKAVKKWKLRKRTKK